MLRCLAGLLAAALVSIACAQDDAVVVTATRFRDLKRDLPVGVTLITADDLKKSATSNLPEILAQFGLVHVRDNAGTPNQQVDLRGFGITGDQNTLVLVDGVRFSENELVPAQLTAIPLESIERIEVVRGSGAVLYGGGATGGTVNIITRRGAAAGVRGYGLARAGGFGTKELRTGVAAGLNEALGLSLDASHEDSNGYRRNNHFRQTNLATTLDARGRDARGFLRLAVSDQALGLPGALTESQIAADRRQAANPDDASERNDALFSAGGAWNLGRHELAADASYRDKAASAFFRPAFFVDTRARVKSLAPRAKLRFQALGREHDVTLGVDLEELDYGSLSAASPTTTAAPFSRRNGEQTHRALYGLANFWLAEQTRLVAGARGQRTEERLAEAVFPADDRRQTHDLEAYEVALRQGFGAGWWAYGKYGKSFRIASFDENACFFPPCAAVLLEPQRAKSAELGLEYDRGAWHARAALYDMRLEDELYFSPLAGANINLSPTRRKGFEFEGAWRATPALELRAALALMEARFESGVYGGVDVSGKDVPLVPEAIASAGVHWRFTEKSRFSVNARYVGKQRFDNDQANTFPRQQPDYTLVDLKLEQRIERVELALELRNAFDRKYFSYGAVNFFGTGFSAYPAPERAAYVSVAYRLD